MKKLTRQRLFNRAWRRSKYKVKCEDEQEQFWLHWNGLTSFIGSSISEDEVASFCEKIDALGVTKTLEPTMDELLKHCDRFTDDVDRRFLCDLEMIHDNAEPRQWERELRAFAKAHGLKIPKDKGAPSKKKEPPKPKPKPKGMSGYLRSLMKG